VGIDPTVEDQFSGIKGKVVDGEYLGADDYDQILVGSQFVSKYAFGVLPGIIVLKSVEPGTTVRMTVAGVTREVTVKGIVKSKVIELASRVYMPAQEFKNLIGRDDYNVSEIAIRLKPGTDANVFRTMLLADGLGSYAKVQTAVEVLPGMFSDITKTLSILGNAFGSIGLVVASITIFIVIFINALTRRKYIGILKGIGVTAAAIQWSYVFQSMFYALCGSALGLLVLYGILVPYVAVHPIDFPTADGILYAPLSGTLIRVALLATATIIAGYIPSRMIVQRNTLDSILGRN
jgi:ABC-type lipoprotein release transport system permease subunit